MDANAISNVSASAKPERKLAVHFPHSKSFILLIYMFSIVIYPPFPSSGEGSNSSTSPHPSEQPLSSSHPSGHGQPLTVAHGAALTSIPNTPIGNTALPEHIYPSHTGTDLSSAGPGYTVNFQR